MRAKGRCGISAWWRVFPGSTRCWTSLKKGSRGSGNQSQLSSAASHIPRVLHRCAGRLIKAAEDRGAATVLCFDEIALSRVD